MKEFSVREEAIIKIIGRKGMTIEQISTALFHDDRDAPFDDKITVANSIRRIIKKCRFHNLPWTLKKTRVNNRLLIKRIRL